MRRDITTASGRSLTSALAAAGLAALLSVGSTLVHAQSHWQPSTQTDAKVALPAHLASFAKLPPGSVTSMVRTSGKSDAWELRLPDGGSYRVATPQRLRHANGDVTHSAVIQGADAAYAVTLTEGREASFGGWITPRGRFRFESWGEQGWLIALDHPDLREVALEGDAIAPSRRTNAPSRPARDVATVRKASVTQLDVLFLHSAGFAARYPGGAGTTRVNHLVAIANQIFANSDVSLALRVVGVDAVDYPDDVSNSTALAALRSSLDPSAVPAPALSGLRARRAATGADLITLVRPHDIEVRGSCGQAFIFGGGSGQGVNVLSDGVSSWSICSDETYAHEVGHNLGAEHQNGANSPNAGFGTAHVVLGQFHTVMGSFGTGEPNRGLRLQRFSNPQQFCGGRPCGVAGLSDNARRLRNNLAAVAAYQVERSSAPMVQPPAAQDPDVDVDGVPESRDAFPHDARYAADRDLDGAADGVDVFPDDPGESGDRDRDGIGDNADADRDGDGVVNALDAFALDPAESRDADLDGTGDNADRFDSNAREWGDVDADSVGDNADPDTDGDSVPDFDNAALDLLVASVGTDRVLRLDGPSGRLIAIEIAEAHAPFALGPKSALAWNPYRRKVEALLASEVRRYDSAARQREATVLRSFRNSAVPGLRSGLSAAMALGPDGSVFVADGNNNSLHRFDAVTALERVGGVFSDAAYFTQPARALRVTPQGALWTLDSRGNVTEVDTASGELRRALSPLAGTTPLSPDALAMAFGPDGGLYVADAAGHRVVRFDVTAGGAVRDHVSAGSGGLSLPAGLVFDPQGRLYVSSAGSDQILRYDGATGVFLDVYSQLPTGLLREPRALQFVPKVTDRFPRDAQRQYRPRAGAWYNPQRSGQGMELQRAGNTLALAWYTFEADGRPTWYLAVGPLLGSQWQASLQRYTWDGRQAIAVEVGSAALRFLSEDRADFSWELDGRRGGEPIEHLQTGRSVETQFPTAVWYPPATPGWGYSVTRQGDVLAIIAFVFDKAGQPTWALGVGAAGASRFPLQRLRAPNLCPGCSGTVAPIIADVGSVDFLPRDDDRANGAINFVDAEVDWRVEAIDLLRLTDTPTQRDGSPKP